MAGSVTEPRPTIPPRAEASRLPDPGRPTRLSAAVFAAKVRLLQVRRAVQDLTGGVRRLPSGEAEAFPHVLAECRTPLWSEAAPGERALQVGKVQNLRSAVRTLNGTVIGPADLFSFWKQVGRATPSRGYVDGRQLLEGCLIPAVGGGLCQLSNALYDAALQAGLEVVERHPHTRVIPGSAAAQGRDATVAWNYIDLRFRSQISVLIQAFLTPDELVVRVRSEPPPPAPRTTLPVLTLLATPRKVAATVLDPTAHSCGSCGVTECFRHGSGPALKDGRTAFLVDEWWPEFDRYLAEIARPEDVLAIPLDGQRWRRPRYRWRTESFGSVHTATVSTLLRAYRSRRVSRYGARRLQTGLEAAEALAQELAQSLTPDVTHVCVAQELLPFLWREGHLGGRTFDVLMTRLPLAELHRRLDAAFATHPERTTLGEYRAPEWLVRTEREALAAAEHLVTPHHGIAATAPGRARLLEWALPTTLPSLSPAPGRTVLFPGPTAARKGAYELREAAQELDLEIVLAGSELEGDGFWEGVRTRRTAPGSRPLEGVAAVVQPALVEDRPRLLLAALAAGIPVIAPAAGGLPAPGVVRVEYGDVEALREALQSLLH